MPVPPGRVRGPSYGRDDSALAYPRRRDVLSWDVDDRKRHPWTVAYMKGMWARRDKEAFEGAEHTLRQAQEMQRDGDAPPDRWTRLHSQVRAERRDQMLVWRARPRRRRPVARVVYVHGGGYVHPLTPDYWRLVRALGRAPAEVVVPAYPLAPKSVVPAHIQKPNYARESVSIFTWSRCTSHVFCIRFEFENEGGSIKIKSYLPLCVPNQVVQSA